MRFVNEYGDDGYESDSDVAETEYTPYISSIGYTADELNDGIRSSIRKPNSFIELADLIEEAMEFTDKQG